MSKLLNAYKLSNCDAKLSISFTIYTIYRISQLVVLFISYQIVMQYQSHLPYVPYSLQMSVDFPNTCYNIYSIMRIKCVKFIIYEWV